MLTNPWVGSTTPFRTGWAISLLGPKRNLEHAGVSHWNHTYPFWPFESFSSGCFHSRFVLSLMLWRLESWILLSSFVFLLSPIVTIFATSKMKLNKNSTNFMTAETQGLYTRLERGILSGDSFCASQLYYFTFTCIPTISSLTHLVPSSVLPQKVQRENSLSPLWTMFVHTF